MQNHVTFNAQLIKAGALYAPHGSGAISLVDARDIADAAAAVLLDPAAHAGKAYTLTGGEALTDAQQTAIIISCAIGREVNYVDVPEAAAVEAMSGLGFPPMIVDWLMSLNYVIKQGWAAGVMLRSSTGTATRTRQVLDCIAALIDALHARGAGDEAIYRTRLEDGFGRAARLRWPNYLASLPRLAALLTADALEREIEVEFLRGAVTQRRLTAPTRSARHWPWPVQVASFGGFELTVGGEPLRSTAGKAQRKTLELLRALAAHGHRGVTAERLADHLWPASDGAAARAALKVTLGRLRKLLGNDAAVEQGEGRLTLAPTLVHLDTDCFDTACDAIEAAGEATPPAQITALARELTRWYRGPFLDGEEVNPLLLGTRHRLHARFLRAASALAALLQRRGEPAAAVDLLEAAALIDPVDEDLHRRLIRLLREQGEHAAALRAYRRLRESLSYTLGVLPGAATQECVAGLTDGGEVG